MREAAVGMGGTQTQLVGQSSSYRALPGILTGVILAVARAAGETCRASLPDLQQLLV